MTLTRQNLIKMQLPSLLLILNQLNFFCDVKTIVMQITYSTLEFALKGTERLILKLLTELKHEVREMKTQIAALQAVSSLEEPLEEDFMMPDGVSLPCTSLEQLKLLDEELKTSKPLQKHLVCYEFQTLLCLKKNTLVNNIIEKIRFYGQFTPSSI